MLVFPCPSCGSKLQMSEELAGKKVRCASCQGVITAPTQGVGSDAITAGPGPAVASTPAAPTAFAPGESRRASPAAAEPEPAAERGDRPAPPAQSGGSMAAAAAGISIGAIVFVVLGV